MVVSEILKTCSHAKVAHAAVASLGREFFERIDSAAVSHGVEPGAFAAKAVRDFDRQADDRQRHALECAVRRADMPLLQGLRMILEDALHAEPR